MKLHSAVRLALVAILCTLSAVSTAFDLDPFLYAQGYEIRLARSAAPASVSSIASVWVLGRQGYERVIQGTNGFNCLVERGWAEIATPRTFLDPRMKAPICFNALASETVMQRVFFRTRLVLEGKSREQVDQAVSAAYLDGTLRSPVTTAVAYMMSSGQWLGETFGHWHPHMMIYAPYISAADLGKQRLEDVGPMMAELAGTPNALFVVPMPKFVEFQE